MSNPSPPTTVALVRKMGGLHEILEGFGLTERDVPFEAPAELAERLSGDPRFERVAAPTTTFPFPNPE